MTKRILLVGKLETVIDEVMSWLQVPDVEVYGGTGQVSYPAFARTAADIDTRIRYLLPALATTQRQEVQL